MKRDILCNDYEHGGLRMFDLHLFSYAQKSIWVKHLLDPAYSSFWKILEMSVLENFTLTGQSCLGLMLPIVF